MGVLSEYVVNKMLEHVLKKNAYTQPTNIYIALFDDDPTDSGVECSGSTYERVKCNDWVSASGRMTSNTNKIEFPEAEDDWGVLKYIVIYDSETSGNILGYVEITPYTVQDGDNLYVTANDLDAKWKSGGACNTTANAMLNHIFKVSAFTQPTDLYVGASKADPKDDASGITEPSGLAYARKIHNNWNSASNKEITNDGDILFTPSSGSWGTITYGFIAKHLTSVSESDILFYGELNTPTTIGNGDTLEYSNKGLKVRVDYEPGP